MVSAPRSETGEMPRSRASCASGGSRSPGRRMPIPMAWPSRATASAVTSPPRTGTKTVCSTTRRSAAPVSGVVDVLEDILDHLLQLEALVRRRDVLLRRAHGRLAVGGHHRPAAAGLDARPALGHQPAST